MAIADCVFPNWVEERVSPSRGPQLEVPSVFFPFQYLWL